MSNDTYFQRYVNDLATPDPILLDWIHLKDGRFNAKGDGVTSDSAAVQAAIDYAVANHCGIIVDAVQVGYLIDTPLDCHNLDSLTMIGEGKYIPAFGLNLVAPPGGSVFIGKTGTGGCVFDCVGSNGIRFKDFTISTMGVTGASTVGVIGGTSTRVDSGAPGGAGCTFDISIVMKATGVSIPFYFLNLNLSTFKEIWTLGDYGIVMCGGNDLGITPPYGAYGTAIDNDGNIFEGSNTILTYGTSVGLYFVNVHDLHGFVYIATINGGPSYSGFNWATYIYNCSDFELHLEVDYYPSVAWLNGVCSGINLKGSHFPNATPVPSGLAIIAYITCTKLEASSFLIRPVSGLLPNNNYHYTTPVGNPATVIHISNCEFLYDNRVSQYLFYFNATAAETTPFWSLRAEGVAGTVNYSFLINGSAAATTKYRMLLNSLMVGTG